MEEAVLADLTVSLAPREKKAYAAALPAGREGIIRATIRANDDFDVDNQAYAVAGRRRLSVLLVTEGNLFLEKGLQANPRIIGSVAGPEEWTAASRERYDVVILDGFVPAELPPANYLVLRYGQPAPLLRGIREPVLLRPEHPVTSLVDLSNVVIEEAVAVEVPPSGVALMSGGGQPLMVASEAGAYRTVDVGFDVRASNLPLTPSFPVLLSSTLQWLGSSSTDEGGQSPRARRFAGACPLAIVMAGRPWCRPAAPPSRSPSVTASSPLNGRTRRGCTRFAAAPRTADGRQSAECRRVGHPPRCSGERPCAAAVRAGAAGPRRDGSSWRTALGGVSAVGLGVAVFLEAKKPAPDPRAAGNVIGVMRFSHPAALLLILVVPFVYLLVARRGRAESAARARWSPVFKGATALFLVLAVSGVEVPAAKRAAAMVFVVDRSESVAQSEKAAALEYLAGAVARLSRDDEAGVVVFAKEAVIEHPLTRGLSVGDVQSSPAPTRSDIGKGLSLARSMLAGRPDAVKRIVVMSDGNQNLGDALREAALTAMEEIAIDVVPLRTAAEVSGRRRLPAGCVRAERRQARRALRSPDHPARSGEVGGRIACAARRHAAFDAPGSAGVGGAGGFEDSGTDRRARVSPVPNRHPGVWRDEPGIRRRYRSRGVCPRARHRAPRHRTSAWTA